MAMSKRTSEQPRRGDRLNERTLRRYLRAAMESNGTPLPGTRGLVEPCFTVPIVNSDTVAIEAFHAVSLDRSVQITSPELFTSRSFQARTILNSTLSPTNAAIATDRIPAGSAGSAYVSGVCAAKMTDAEAEVFRSGGGTVIWQQDDLDDSDERWSVVRMGGAPQTLMVVIIGGQTLNNVPVIQYSADPFTPSSAYDPDVDTTYQSGLGNGWIYNARGQPDRRVLVRHNFQGNIDPAIQGAVYVAGGPVTLTTASGATMQAYTIRYP